MAITFSELGKMGRLGNILFQAATTIALALRNNDTYEFPKTWIDRKYFNIPEDRFVDKLYFYETYNEQYYHYSKIPYKKNLNINGYVQSYKYFESHSDIIKQLLTPNIITDKQNYTSIHVRRTDYLIHKGCYNILTRDNYYDQAMELSGGKKFLIFSDDLAYCKNIFGGNEFDFAEGNHPVKDLSLMLNCSGNIIANSSFSWWGAWLNEVQNVIAPKIWFGPELAKTHDTKDLCPNNWIRI